MRLQEVTVHHHQAIVLRQGVTARRQAVEEVDIHLQEDQGNKVIISLDSII